MTSALILTMFLLVAVVSSNETARGLYDPHPPSSYLSMEPNHNLAHDKGPEGPAGLGGLGYGGGLYLRGLYGSTLTNAKLRLQQQRQPDAHTPETDGRHNHEP